MSITVHYLSSESKDWEGWDRYVDIAPDSTFFHRAGWSRILREAFSHKPYYLYAKQGGEIVGILPLGHVKTLLFGNSLMSVPFCVYGGVVANTDEIADMLLNEACRLAESLKVDSLELRNCKPSGKEWPTKSLYVTFRKPLLQGHEAILKAIPNKQRAVVRKGIKAGLESEEGWHADRVYRVYAESVRNLGTPVFPAKYFRLLRVVFGTDCRSLMITHSGLDVAGVVSFYFKDQVLPYYAGSTAASRDVYAHGFMYWQLMCNASDQGVRIFDYGRSKVDTGSFSFKKNWGFEPEPLFYEYYLVGSSDIPEVNPTNPKYQWLIKTWKKLPLPMANRVGPILARGLG